MKKYFFFFYPLLITALLSTSCKKKDSLTGPTLFLRVGTGYTSTDATVHPGDSILVGVNAASNGSPLATFEIRSTFDNAAIDSAYYTESITAGSNAASNYVKDFHIHTRHHAGKELYTFRITDAINSKLEQSILLTVQ